MDAPLRYRWVHAQASRPWKLKKHRFLMNFVGRTLSSRTLKAIQALYQDLFLFFLCALTLRQFLLASLHCKEAILAPCRLHTLVLEVQVAHPLVAPSLAREWIWSTNLFSCLLFYSYHVFYLIFLQLNTKIA